MSITSVVNDLVTSVSVINALKPLPPTISGYSVAGKDDLALDPAGGQTVQINGTGFLPGATITFDGSAVAVVTYVNPNQLTFTSPAKTAGTYTIYAVNPDGGTAIYVPGIIYSTLPTWTTAAGSLGSYYETTSISNTVVAAGDAPVTYSLYSGSLPTGSTLSANGVITGTAPVDSSSTTYSFTIQASDAQLQDSTRSFSLTINVDAVTWVSPANATTYTSAVDSAISTVTLSATDAAGYAVSYSANALPTGLSLSGANITGTPTVIADSSTLLTATAATTNRTAVRTINWSITVANDPYFEYNTLLIPGASTTFVDDASTNNFAVTINGDTKPNNFNPYTPGYYSNYFDGTGDYLQCAYNSAFDLSSSDFTIESWVCTTDASSNYPSIIGRWQSAGNACWDFRPRSTDIGNYFVFIYSTNGTTPVSVNSNTVITDGAWHHLVAVRSGNNFALFVDGIRKQTASFTGVTIFNSVSSPLYVGYDPYGTTYYTGYQSNTRLVKGTAVYDPTLTTLTVPTTPLTAIANTSLLTCQSNRFIDNSTNNFTLTVNGNTSISSFDPFVPNTSYSTYGSGYFDGTGDYLTSTPSSQYAFGQGDLTVEMWIYPTSNISSTTNIGLFYVDQINALAIGLNNGYIAWARRDVAYDLVSSYIPPLNTWTHVAVVRTGAVGYIFANGTIVGTVTASGGNPSNNSNYVSTTGIPYIAGNYGGGAGNGYFPGYITDVRVVKGTAVYTTTFTPPTTPLTAIANTSLLTLQNNQSVNNNIFLDNSTNNFFVTRNGNTTQGTFSPYGPNWSNYFDGTGDYLQTPSSSSLGFGTSNFTMEMWVYSGANGTGTRCGGNGTGGSWSSGNWVLATSTPGNVNKFCLGVNNTLSDLLASTSTFNNSQWMHVAITRSGNSWAMFVNGVRESTATSSVSLDNGGSKSITLGQSNIAGDSMWAGYISNFRVVIGTAVYSPSSTTITVPTTPLTPITNTQLLTCIDNRFADDSINNFTITKNGDTSVQRFSPFNPSSVTPTSYSGYFDGTGDYLTIPASTILDVGNTSWTIECWVYMNNTTGTQMIVGYNNLSASDFWDLTVVSGVPTFKRRIGGSEVAVSGGTISANIFTNVAVVRNGTAVTIYLNGSSVATNANVSMPTSMSDQILGIGANRYSAGYDYYFNGFISNLRMVKGTAVYTSNFTPSTTPLTAIANTSLLTLQSPTFIDNSTNNFTITAVGNTQPTIQNPFGYTSATTNGYTVSTIGGSGYFDGTGDYLTVDHSTAFNLSGIAFTIEAWVYTITSSGYRNILTKRPASAGPSYQIWINNTDNKIGIGNATTPQYSNSQIATNTWNHVAWTYDGSATSKMWINGVLDTTVTLSPSADNANPITIGAWGLNGSEYFNGYITDVRIVKGSQVYTTAFIPPATPSTAIQNTVLLNNMTSAGIYDSAMMNNMETVSDAKLSTAVSKFGGSSMYFDGTGDGLLAQSSPNLSMGDGNFTIEFWYYPTTTAGTNPAIMCNSNGTPAFVAGLWALHAPHSTHANKYSLWVASYANNQALLVSSSNIATNTWSFITITRSGNTWRMFVNGTIEATATHAGVLDNGGGYPLYIGYQPNADAGRYITGYIDDLRMTKGYARYTSNFTAPTVAFPVY